jgi:hypothetical protein
MKILINQAYPIPIDPISRIRKTTNKDAKGKEPENMNFLE